MLLPRARVIIDNDFAGDPDDLFQLVHHLLSPSVEVPFVVASHLAVGDVFDSSGRSADNAERIASETIALLPDGLRVPVVAGSNSGLANTRTPIASPAAEAIVVEAMRDDTELPLFVAVGGGLTELASALLIEPRIADRLTAVWIGGPEHPGHADPPPGIGAVEYNLNIDIPAAQFVFNESTVPLWQIPRDAYRQCLLSLSELEVRVRPQGAVGAHLVASLDRAFDVGIASGRNLGETYCLGDSPLVLVTALQTAFEPDSASSNHVTVPTPMLTDDGQYEAHSDGRPLRVYTRIDTRLMFEDLFAKLELLARQQ